MPDTWNASQGSTPKSLAAPTMGKNKTKDDIPLIVPLAFIALFLVPSVSPAILAAG